MAWTDDELRAAIHEAAVADGFSVSIDHLSRGDVVMDGEVTSFRRLLTALGIDHQPKPELPDTPGSVIYDVDLGEGVSATVLTRDREGYWTGLDAETHIRLTLKPERITSFGGVLDLDKVRGENDA
ncbi:hypothetical protein [Citricoccus sp. NR2]|uniref:hypothetical protein n=1 Tax=Citricoccus sp. NR2 TaxID=3004095 RepID=UPI0022DD4372|nr:hypothetical protein [Citricoccus sp. NR2]WBL18496.1 hypothetical protein O1A05_12110 [Citricoccus sp. NR2]